MKYLEMKSYLSGNYLDAFNEVEKHALLTYGDAVKIDDALVDLIDALCEAQKSNEPAEKVVGKDIPKFCKEFFTETKRSVPEIIYATLIVLFVWSILSCLEAFGYFLIGDLSSVNEPINAFPILIGWAVVALCSTINIFVTAKFIAYQKRATYLFWLLTFVFLAVIEVTMNLIGNLVTLPVSFLTLLLIFGLLAIFSGILSIVLYEIKKKETVESEDEQIRAMVKEFDLWKMKFDGRNQRLIQNGFQPEPKENFEKKFIRHSAHLKGDIFSEWFGYMLFAILFPLVTLLVYLIVKDVAVIPWGCFASALFDIPYLYFGLKYVKIRISSLKNHQKVVDYCKENHLSIYDFKEKIISQF